MHYDFAITARKARPDDDIGAHALQVLSRLAAAGLRCVAFVGSRPPPEIRATLPATIEFVHVRTDSTPLAGNMGGTALNFTRDLCGRLLDFLRENSIRMIEFPDRCAEGHFFIQHNRVHRLIPVVAVRLHGPTFLLDEANARRVCTEQQAFVYAAELESVQSADHVLHAGGSLPDRVLASFPPAVAREIAARAALIPPPAPAPFSRPLSARPATTSRNLVYAGPLDYLAGLDLLVLNAVRHLADRPASPWRFTFLGEDTDTAGGHSFLAYLRALIPDQHRDRFVFATADSPADREQRLDHADAFILPARFPRRHAALHELLPRHQPLAASTQSELDPAARPHAPILTFDSENPADWTALLDTLASDSAPETVAAPTPNDNLARRYTGLPAVQPAPRKNVRLTIVIPHHEDLDNLASLLARLHAEPARDLLEIVVVDDGSSPPVWARLQELVAADPRVSLLRTPRPRSGPFIARRIGTESAAADHVAYVDSDDHIDTDLYLAYARALAGTPALDVVLPAMRCFGRETSHWIPLPKARFSTFFTGFSHAGLVGKKDVLLRAFAHAQDAARDIVHGEDCILSLSLLFGGARIAGLLEIAYHYNRTSARTRSQTNPAQIWRSRHLREQHYDLCIAQGIAAGTVTPLDLRVLRQLALNLPPEYGAINLHRRSNRVPWHTHLYRACRSLLGDPRYRA